MAEFLTELDARAIDGRKWRLLAPLVYDSDILGLITVPAGFDTDLASIPRIARPLITGMGNDRKPAVIHDHLYSIRHLPRSEADAVFLEALECLRVPWIKRRAMWAAVRAGGWVVYAASSMRRGSSSE